MTPQDLLAYCLAKPGAWEDDVVVKVGPKIFAFLGSGAGVGLKCGQSREEADEWLTRYPDDELLAAVDDSYDAVVARLPKRDRPAPS